jgi:tetratricopeptide (TPR) repeat protein
MVASIGRRASRYASTAVHAPAVSAWRAGWDRARPFVGTDVILPAGVAVAVFAVAYDGGAYSLASRLSLGIAVWWTNALAVALALVPRAPVPRAAAATAVPLAGLAVLALLSTRWGATTERALAEADRVALYLGVFALVVLVTRRGSAARWADALAVALVGVAVIALASRFFEVFGTQERGLAELLPGAEMRLSFPVGYWNGLAILVALALPLLLRAAAAPRSAVARGAAVAPIPALAAVIYLSSSRGGAATFIAGALGFVLLSGRRWAALGALAVGAAGSAVAVAALLARHELVNEPLSAAAAEQGPGAAALVAAACVGCAFLYALGAAVARYVPPAPAVVRYGVGAILVAASAAAVLAADPRARFEAFREPFGGAEAANPDFVRTHLLSGSGSGRWQFWAGAVDQFRSAPLLGGGAGSYEAWWAQHGTLAAFVRDAHSLYLETLAELGIVGLSLLLLTAFAALAVALARLGRRGSDRESVAAVTAVFLAYGVAAGIDWMWELTVVTLVAVVCLGLMTGPATARDPRREDAGWEDDTVDGLTPQPARRPLLLVGAAVAVSAVVVGAHASPLLSDVAIRDSEQAVAADDVERARERARAARSLQPWAASPYLQLALVEERAGDLGAARASIAEAIERDERDWRLWLVRARLETTSGAVGEARESLLRAIELNPRSPLFAGVNP